MKKRLLVLGLICSLALCGCGETTVPDNRFVEITDSNGLVYDIDTKVVYYNQCTSNLYYVRIPFYSEHGKLCRYVDDEIVEIGE